MTLFIFFALGALEHWIGACPNVVPTFECVVCNHFIKFNFLLFLIF